MFHYPVRQENRYLFQQDKKVPGTKNFDGKLRSMKDQVTVPGNKKCTELGG